ncbi:taste receptor type 1 member 1-like, partial [Clarias magur]
MLRCVFLGCLLNLAFHFFAKHECKADEFNLPGHYKLGGIFHVHSTSDVVVPSSPMALECNT